MDRIVGIETEYGCLLSEDEPHVNSELWPAKVKNYLFRKANAGTIDLHYRDYEEPPGNGGFLLNGGRLYLDMGHIEYASPECLHLHDLVTYELAGDDLLQSSLVALGAEDRVSFIKNNVDHHTGATFGCHENYLMKREAQFTPPILGTLLTFLATRQIFTGSGRVGQSNPLAFDFEPPQSETQVNFQLSQRADHIVNDIYQWVQFNRAIINARDEPLADYRKYRRLHLLIGDSNMSPYANALKVGTTACVLSLLEEGRLPRNLVTNWLLENWGFVLEAIPHNCEALIGGVDWITKKWLLDAFIQSEGLRWDDPWLQSIDLEYHNIDPRRGLFFGVTPGKRIAEWNNSVRRPSATHVPPANTRASGRARAVAFFQSCNLPYEINWDSIACDSRDFLVMGNPFETYNDEVERFLAKPRTTNTDSECADR